MDVLVATVGIFKDLIKHQFGYVSKSKKNRMILEERLYHLRDLRDTVRRKVYLATANGMAIKNEVEDWLNCAQQLLDEIEHLLYEDKANFKCLDVRSRYWIGRRCEKMVQIAVVLEDKGYEFRDQVANPMHFDTRKSVFEEITKSLVDDKISKIGIYGMAGVGKTHMVQQVEKGAFDEVAMAVFSENPDLGRIQRQLADCLHLTLHEESDEGRARELCNRFKNGGKILIILDDVWNYRITLKQIGIPEDVDNSTGVCKTLLISRSQLVCKQRGCEKVIQIGPLARHEAWQLFKETVGDFIEADPEIHRVAEELCDTCGGLPLAICAVGGVLRGKEDKLVWRDALERLKHVQGEAIDGMEATVYSVIEQSYGYLKQADVKSCFLHCCLFPEDADISIEELVWFGKGTKFLERTDRTSIERARERTHVIVDKLKAFSLLFEGSEEDKVKMNGVVRDVGILIASRDPNFLFVVINDVDVWPDKDDYRSCRTISFRTSHRVHGLPDQLDCPELHTFILEHLSDAPGEDSKLQLSSNFFEGMENLEVLVLKNIKLVLSSLSHLVSLRMLRLINCQFVDLSFPQELENLELLAIHFPECETKVLDIEQLTALRWLDFEGLEDGIGFSSGSQSRLSKLEEFGATLPHLNETKNVGIRNIPSQDGLKVLVVNGEVSCVDFEKYLENLGFSDAGSFGRLTILKVYGCQSMKYLFSPSTARCLVKLEELVIADCEKLEEIIGRSDDDVTDKVNFDQLKRMLLHNLPKLISIYPSKTSTTKRNQQPPLFNQKVMFPVLETLELCKLNRIQAIWDKKLLPVLKAKESFQHLKILTVEHCEMMEEILAYEVGLGEPAEANDESHAFPQLGSVILDLPKLKRFNRSWGNDDDDEEEEEDEEEDDKSTLQALVNHKVRFPKLDNLHMCDTLWY